jgi:hypothetical protein
MHTKMCCGGLLRQGKTYTLCAGKSPLRPELSLLPTHQPEFSTVSPVDPSSSKMRSPFVKLKNEDPSPAKGVNTPQLF